jgi:hypothetical protein
MLVRIDCWLVDGLDDKGDLDDGLDDKWMD